MRQNQHYISPAYARTLVLAKRRHSAQQHLAITRNSQLASSEAIPLTLRPWCRNGPFRLFGNGRVGNRRLVDALRLVYLFVRDGRLAGLRCRRCDGGGSGGARRGLVSEVAEVGERLLRNLLGLQRIKMGGLYISWRSSGSVLYVWLTLLLLTQWQNPAWRQQQLDSLPRLPYLIVCFKHPRLQESQLDGTFRCSKTTC